MSTPLRSSVQPSQVLPQLAWCQVAETVDTTPVLLVSVERTRSLVTASAIWPNSPPPQNTGAPRGGLWSVCLCLALRQASIADGCWLGISSQVRTNIRQNPGSFRVN